MTQKFIEGNWEPHRLVIMSFRGSRSVAWYNSPEYAPLKALRQTCAKTRRPYCTGGCLTGAVTGDCPVNDGERQIDRVYKLPICRRGSGP